MAEWVVEDVASTGETPVVGEPRGGVGDLRNPDFPDRVGPNEDWSGSIEAVNTSDETHTFRISKDGEVKATFDLSPGGSRTITFRGTGPASFLISLERKVEKKPPISKKEMVGIGLAIAVGTGLAYKYLR